MDEARTLLLHLLETKPQPRANAPTYGVWTVDYDPYFLLGKVELLCGNREQAERYFAASRLYGVAERDPEKRRAMEAQKPRIPAWASTEPKG